MKYPISERVEMTLKSVLVWGLWALQWLLAKVVPTADFTYRAKQFYFTTWTRWFAKRKYK